MKIEWNKRYTTIAMYSFIVICCSIIFYRIASDMTIFTTKLSEILAILQPFIIGGVIAYLLNFVLKFYEEQLSKTEWFKNLRPKGKRAIGIVLTYITAAIVLSLFMKFVLPQLVDSIIGLVNDIPTYVENVTNLANEVMDRFDLGPEYLNLVTEKWQDFIDFVVKFVTNLLPVFGNLVKLIASSIWNIILGLIVSIYLLIDKENFYALSRKLTYALFSSKYADKIIELAERSNDTFGKFISGKILDSAIIGVLTFVLLTIFKMPYTILISVIIGITNIIPFFGPFFGAIPSAIIILFVSPVKALWFLVIIVVIQQLDGNVIGPKILGDSIGISAFWILFSLLVAGKLLGLVGMIIGVPVFAIIYSVIKEVVEFRLEKKGLPKETSDYIHK